MDKKKIQTEILLEAKRDGVLKPKYQAMTDEEMLEVFFRRVEERLKRRRPEADGGLEKEREYRPSAEHGKRPAAYTQSAPWC